MAGLGRTFDARSAGVAGGTALVSALAGAAIGASAAGIGPGHVLIGLAAVAVAVATVASPRAGLALLFASLAVPLHGGVLGFELRAAHLVMAAYVVGTALRGADGGRAVPRALALPLVLVGIGGILAAFAGPRPGGSLFSLFDVFLLPLAAAAAVAANFDARRDIGLLVVAAAGALTLAAGAGVLQASGFTPGPLDPIEEGRANGLFEHPNVLSGFVAPLTALMTGIAVCNWRDVPFSPAVLVAPPLLGVAALVFTLSRGALAGLAVALVAMMALLIVRRQVVAVLGVVLVVVLALFVTLPQVPQSQRSAFAERFQRLFQPGTETGRQVAFEQALAAMREHPLTGVGALTFGRLSRESSPIGDVEAGREHAHNLLFETFLSLGPLGVLGLLWLLAGASLRYFRATRAGPRTVPLATGWSVGAIAAFAAILVQGVGDFVFSNLEPLGLLLIMLAVAYVPGFAPEGRGAAAYSSAP